MNSQGATIVSLCPFPIDEFKPGIIPSNFHIDPAKEGDIEILNIGTNVTSRMRVPVMGNVIDMTVPAMTLARAIVEDRNTGQLYYSPEAKPGLFFVEGTYSKEEVKKHFQKEIDEANMYQKNWFLQLVKLADDDWQKSHQHRYISDTQRYAARALGLTKDWNLTITEVADKRCVACFSQMHQQASICPICKTNQSEFLAAQAAVAAGVPKAAVKA
jgi:hypothetical protein